jgi:hypothetical protein
VQERKEVHRGGGRLRCAVVAALIGICLSAAARGGATESFPRLCNGDLGGFAPRYAFAGSEGSRARRAGVFSAYADPYMIDGLVACRLVAGFETASLSVWLDWNHLGHPLYREDNVIAAFGGRLFVEGLRLEAAPAIDRREVRGFPAGRSLSLRMAVSFRRGEGVWVGASRSMYRSDPREARGTAFFLRVRAGSFAATFNRVASLDRGQDWRFSLEVWLARQCRIASGYRWMSRELSCGILVEFVPVLLDVSWSQNSALGSTLSIGIGRWWEW